MSKPNPFSNPAFKKNDAPVPAAFNLVNQTSNFNSVFAVKPLDQAEANTIEKLLVENFQPGTISDEQTVSDIAQLKTITSEIKAIGKQGTVLMGERVHKAKELLKPYKDGTFSKWLESTFGTRKTGYNMLNYYELYNALPQLELKENFKKIPHKTAYILASREGDLEKKTEIIREYSDLSHEELVMLIQEKFPPLASDKRSKKDVNSSVIADIRDSLKKLQKRKDALTEANKDELIELRDMLDSLIALCNV